LQKQRKKTTIIINHIKLPEPVPVPVPQPIFPKQENIGLGLQHSTGGGHGSQQHLFSQQQLL
jgi:hypothetical protein